jgi:hypothetical protein
MNCVSAAQKKRYGLLRAAAAPSAGAASVSRAEAGITVAAPIAAMKLRRVTLFKGSSSDLTLSHRRHVGASGTATTAHEYCN